MILRQINGISFFQFPHLAAFPEICHGIFTRKSGFSRSPYCSLNVSYDVGDSKSNVFRNRQSISSCIDAQDLVFVKQTHATDVLIFKKMETPQTLQKIVSEKGLFGDALVTDIPKKFLAIQVADCQAVLMYDPVRHVVANIHAGWRGSIHNIIAQTITVMQKIFNCNAGHIIAGVGPSLGPCCAEFKNYREEIPRRFWKYKDDSNHFDFWSISRDQLCDAGVLDANIISSRQCTKCNPELFFSYRGEHITGRFAAVIGIR
ncbi:MAG: peptidoglycan editing factor PgeF [Desulfobacterales bacterium]|nr:peptidoglycan editing factor PgeF [Desulfobacterales bacterium]